MADFVLKYADGRGQIHHQVATAASEKELREKYAQQDCVDTWLDREWSDPRVEPGLVERLTGEQMPEFVERIKTALAEARRSEKHGE